MKIIFPALALLLLSGCNLLPSHVGSDDHDHTAEELTNPNHHEMQDHDMMGHGGHSMDHASMVVDALSFIAEMIPHHQEAVDTSLVLLSSTTNPTLATMLEAIISGQNEEIAMMQNRLSDRYPDSDYTPMYMPMMRDTTGITDIQTLEKMYMEDMILHHQGAVDMANAMRNLIVSAQQPISSEQQDILMSFTQAIIDAQTKEIAQFQEILKTH